jgi:hypothetical protein
MKIKEGYILFSAGEEKTMVKIFLNYLERSEFFNQILEDEIRKQWASVYYDALGMQDRLSPLTQIGKVC